MNNNDISVKPPLSVADRQRQISELIYTLMERRGWSQKRLADEMGKDASYLSRVLTGEVGLTLKTIMELESALERKLILTELEIPDIRAKENIRKISPTSANRFKNNRRKPVFLYC